MLIGASIKKVKIGCIATNNKDNFLLPKINKVFLRPEPNFTKSELKVRFGQLVFENDCLDELKKMPCTKKFDIFAKL